MTGSGKGSDDMKAAAEKALAVAMDAGAAQAEAYVSYSTSTKIKVYQQEVEELASSTGSGAGIRVFRDGAMGYAYTSDLSDAGLKQAAATAAAQAAVTAADEFAGLPEPGPAAEPLDIYNERLGLTPLAEKIDLARQAEQAALERDDRIAQVETASYAEGELEVTLINSLGFEDSFRETTCYAFVQTIAEQEGQMQTGISFTTGREPVHLDPTACGQEAADRAVVLLGGSQCSSMSCPVVLDPFVTASIMGMIGTVLTGEAVQKQRSLFAGREGQAVASSGFRLIDDGRHPDGLASAPFDGEGVPTRETALIEDGILQGFLYDAYTGRKAGRASTGNGLRSSYRSLPHVGATNLRIAPGSQSPSDIIGGIDRGFYVMDVTGIHSGVNPVSGDVSVGAAGRIISGGRLVDAVREVTIAGNLLQMLMGVEAVGNDNRWVPFGGSIHAPTLLVGSMSISGK